MLRRGGGGILKFARSQNLDVREFSAPVNAKIAEILPINWGEIKDALKTNEDSTRSIRREK